MLRHICSPGPLIVATSVAYIPIHWCAPISGCQLSEIVQIHQFLVNVYWLIVCLNSHLVSPHPLHLPCHTGQDVVATACVRCAPSPSAWSPFVASCFSTHVCRPGCACSWGWAANSCPADPFSVFASPLPMAQPLYANAHLIRIKKKSPYLLQTYKMCWNLICASTTPDQVASKGNVGEFCTSFFSSSFLNYNGQTSASSH